MESIDLKEGRRRERLTERERLKKRLHVGPERHNAGERYARGSGIKGLKWKE